MVIYRHIQSHIWLYITEYGYLWTYIAICIAIWLYMDIHRHMYRYMAIYGHTSPYVSLYGYIWTYIAICSANEKACKTEPIESGTTLMLLQGRDQSCWSHHRKVSQASGRAKGSHLDTKPFQPTGPFGPGTYLGPFCQWVCLAPKAGPIAAIWACHVPIFCDWSIILVC